MKRWLAAAAVALGAASSVAGASELDLKLPKETSTPSAATNCESVVVRQCTRPREDRPAAGYDELKARRSASNLDQILEAVVIEGDRIRRPSTVREVIEQATQRTTVRNFESGDGGQCLCVTPCPAWPSPCCFCDKGGRDAIIRNIVRH